MQDVVKILRRDAVKERSAPIVESARGGPRKRTQDGRNEHDAFHRKSPGRFVGLVYLITCLAPRICWQGINLIL